MYNFRSPKRGDRYVTYEPGVPCEFTVSSVKIVVRAEEKMSSGVGEDVGGWDIRVKSIARR